MKTRQPLRQDSRGNRGFATSSCEPGLKGCYGVAILPFGEGNSNIGLSKTLAHFVSAARHAGFMFQRKVKIGVNSTWTVVTLSDDGSVTASRYDLADPHHTVELT